MSSGRVACLPTRSDSPEPGPEIKDRAGANLGSGVILILGVVNLLADGLSMATGAYLSLKSELEYYQRERERESWEVEHFPDGERAELVELYKAKGYS